jgi:hypothetical protein
MRCSNLSSKLFCTVLAVPAALLPAQTLMHGAGSGMVRIMPGDGAILEVQEPRDDIPCTVTPSKPALGFDLKFHAGYEVGIPLKDLAGSENVLTMVFRVTPSNRLDDPVYFTQRVRVPPLDANASGTAYLQGAFDLGEGKYHVDWMMRDRGERVCSSYWDSEAELAPKDRQLALVMSPGTVAASEAQQFQNEAPVERNGSEPPLNVKVLVNFAPQDSTAAALQPLDTSALVSILRTLSREPHIGRFSLVAFNLQEQREIYRQENADRIDFPALGEALNTLKLGTVDLKRLSQKNGETEFLSGLIQRELGGADHPDALIFAGPKAMVDESVSSESLKEVGEVEYPVFYMNYNLRPEVQPWRDAIGRAVKFFKGYEYTISRPRDLWVAVTEIVTRAVKFKNGRRSSASASR